MTWLPPEPVPPLAQLAAEIHGGQRPVPDAHSHQVDLDFSTNVNPFPTDPELVEAVARADLARYPDPLATIPRTRLADAWNISVERLALAPGAAEIIYRVTRAFLRPGDSVLLATPTFGEYARAARAVGARVTTIPADKPDFRIPVDRLAARIAHDGPRLVFLCSPNNPTGEELSDVAIHQLVDALPSGSLLVLDESFRSFSHASFVRPHRPDDDRVLHVRSLTKDFALAGLRIAAAIGSPVVLASMGATAPPWSVSTPAQDAVTTAMSRPVLHRIEAQLAEILVLRQELENGLAATGWAPIPSRTGFILSAVPRAAETINQLARRGIQVRSCVSFGLPDYIRVGTQLRPANQRLIEELATIHQTGNDR